MNLKPRSASASGCLVAALALASLGSAAALSSNTSPNVVQSLRARDDDDGLRNPNNFGWVQNWAAIGDSFTAGIGSGNQLGSRLKLDKVWECSRYDYSYVQIVDNALGSSVKRFQFEACSGDRTAQIYDQVDTLRNDLDLVMMTAGGNDLCLGAMIRTCVILAWDGEAACQALIDKAQENIDTILKDNIRDVLDKLNSKMKKDSILVYSGYAPFFNTENEDCADLNKQNWAIRAWQWFEFWTWLRSPLRLTIERRKKFNNLVVGINKVISEVVEEYDKDTQIKFRAVFSDWSDWPSLVDGEFCSPKSTGLYPDPAQPNLLFIKFDTAAAAASENLEAMEEETRQFEEYRKQFRGRLSREYMYDTLLWKSANPAADVLHKLDARAPAPPGCPGDNLPSTPRGIGVPDSFLSIFHPNKAGHEAIAAYGLQNIAYMRAKVLGVDDGLCAAPKDEFTCWQKTGKKAYVEFARVNENYKDFCNNKVKQPDNTINWRAEHTYHQGTPDEHTFVLQLSGGSDEYDKEKCIETFDRIINSCDGGDRNNPKNFKFGGRWIRGNYDYQINPKKDRKMIQKRSGTCKGKWKFLFTSYRIHGRGWASSDWGQRTLLKSMRDCGSAVTGWKFEYCPTGCGDNNEYEWTAKFNLPVYGGAACMKNNWVPRQHDAEWTGEGSEKLGCPGAA
ncbi:SGNH hydrolase-type esterase domain-containing protein [Microdochium trichocladiopsis]|uniref:SGNH hydrolase-type esterase domain-containing protein n=1 Tax=Microdochium trichocladiopsis TaxID=1682393 RepID=A0A9P8YC20_9PEZI|nr:SGNH hydrolase-type esterase domain-containing protein [Microdochium trichocladiopsis]KAH7035723.1 SGNH hydrolase-type esterase domain-containing protein [Microdochium trichocladiopsis]